MFAMRHKSLLATKKDMGEKRNLILVENARIVLAFTDLPKKL
jgi:hypothetical protein